jgi:hypothetical protein
MLMARPVRRRGARAEVRGLAAYDVSISANFQGQSWLTNAYVKVNTSNSQTGASGWPWPSRNTWWDSWPIKVRDVGRRPGVHGGAEASGQTCTALSQRCIGVSTRPPLQATMANQIRIDIGIEVLHVWATPQGCNHMAQLDQHTRSWELVSAADQFKKQGAVNKQ